MAYGTAKQLGLPILGDNILLHPLQQQQENENLE
jgi:hypothetical protein